MVAAASTELKALEECLLNVSGKVPLDVRFRALFTLKGLKNDEAVEIISKGMLILPNPPACELKIAVLGFSDDSALLKHELAYVLGQLKNEAALPKLEAVLRDTAEDPMVRHEVCPPAISEHSVS